MVTASPTWILYHHFFPHWRWLSARDGLRFGPWEKDFPLLVHLKEGEKCPLKRLLWLLAQSCTDKHKANQTFGPFVKRRAMASETGYLHGLLFIMRTWKSQWSAAALSVRLILHTPHVFLHLSSCHPSPLSHSLCPLWKPLSPLALLLSSSSVRLLQAALLPLCLPRVLPLEDMHLGSCCTLLCVLINILAASGRKWVFLRANLLWGGCLEQRKEKMIEEEGHARLFLFSMSEAVKTSNTNQTSRNYE